MSRHLHNVLTVARRHPRLFAVMHHALVTVSGQPDTMATPLPGFWGRSGGGSIDTLRGCSGGCQQGDLPCDCELSGDVGPDADRVIQPPVRTPEDDRAIVRARRWALYLSALGFGALAGLLEAFGAEDMPRLLP